MHTKYTSICQVGFERTVDRNRLTTHWDKDRMRNIGYAFSETYTLARGTQSATRDTVQAHVHYRVQETTQDTVAMARRCGAQGV